MGSLTNKATRRLLLPLVVAGATLIPQPAQALEVYGDGWCYIVGQVQGLGSELECYYIANGPTQTVYVGMPYAWDVFIMRDLGKGFPEQVTLAEGVGLSEGPITRVHTEVGETVYVRMYSGCVPGADFPCGSKGFLGAGLEYGGTHDVAGMPVDVPPLSQGDAQVAGACHIDSTNHYAPALTGTAGTSSVSSTGTLSACISDDFNQPISGERSMGNVVSSGGTPEEPWLWQEPAGTLVGNCTATTVTGTFIIRWEDGSTTVVNQQSASNTWLIRSEGSVTPSVTLTAVDQQAGQPDTLTVSTTRFVGDTVTATKVSTPNAADPLECTESGLTEAHRSGTITFLA